MSENQFAREALAMKQRCDALRKKQIEQEHRPTDEQRSALMKAAAALHGHGEKNHAEDLPEDLAEDPQPENPPGA